MYNSNRKIASIDYVLGCFPQLEKHLKTNTNIEQLNLSEEEITFLKMCKFFADPSNENFDFKNVYMHLQDDWVIIALNSLNIFVKEDTYLISKKKPSKIDGERENY